MEETLIKPDIKSKIDERGNIIIAYRNGNIVKLYLKLKAESKRRRLGFINTNTKTFHVTRDRSKHLFLKLDGYGFNEQVLSDAKLFDKIRLKDKYSEWLIPVSFILDKQNAKYLDYLKAGFERQVFVTLTSIEQFKRPVRF